MFLQKDSGVQKDWAISGCFLSSMLFWVEKEEGYTFLPKDSVTIYDLALKKGIIEKDCTLLKPDNFLKLIGSNLRFISDKKGNMIHFFPSEPDLSGYGSGRFIGEFFWEEQHFCPLDHDEKLLLDVYSKDGSNTVKNGYLRSIRVLI